VINKIKEKSSVLKKDASFIELLGSGGFVLIFKVLGALSGYVFAFVVSKNGAHAYGIYELAYTALMILAVVTKWGLDGATVRFTQEYLAEKQPGKIKSLVHKSVLTISVSAVVFGVAFYFLREIIAGWFNASGLADAYVWVALGLLPFVLLQYYSEALRAFKNLKAFSLLQLGSVLILAVFVFLGLKNIEMPKGEVAVLSFVVAIVVFAALAFIAYKKTYKKRVGKVAATPINFIPILKVGVPLLVSGSLFLVISWTDTLMIGYFMDSTDVGVYRIAFKIATLITFIQFAVNSIAAPAIAEFYAKDDLPSLRKYVKQIGVINAVFSVPVALFILIFSEPLLNLFGAEYGSGAMLLPVLAVGQLVNALAGPVMYILNMTGKEKVSQRIMLWMTGVNIVLNLVLIPQYGLLGAAVATTISMVLWNVIAAILVYKYYKVVAVPFL